MTKVRLNVIAGGVSISVAVVVLFLAGWWFTTGLESEIRGDGFDPSEIRVLSNGKAVRIGPDCIISYVEDGRIAFTLVDVEELRWADQCKRYYGRTVPKLLPRGAKP